MSLSTLIMVLTATAFVLVHVFGARLSFLSGTPRSVAFAARATTYAALLLLTA